MSIETELYQLIIFNLYNTALSVCPIIHAKLVYINTLLQVKKKINTMKKGGEGWLERWMETSMPLNVINE